MIIYAISNVSKQHVIVPHALDGDAEWSYFETKDGWIPWIGAPHCPLPNNVECEVKFRNGNELSDRAEWLRWDNTEGDRDYDIVEYRPILEAPKIVDIPPLNSKIRCLGGTSICTVVAHGRGNKVCIKNEYGDIGIFSVDELEPTFDALVVEAMTDIDAEPDDFTNVQSVVYRMIAAGYRRHE